ncbi:hypothetical protein PU629_06250 [Pullulanibacillus sp. KACC 23026]|uniref:hypothetical protein n=1 Tax=Pullulanibacillus sp. KACC 23026 TaxID=3028315 RepID=UPI0023B11AFD|nr:hypothetical protein [Pullulanibacillus sp. KACC 23026]WEG13965.1 hypothetical protein PU629_06250 [Pullulanibacillus sp. KACC 23026]
MKAQIVENMIDATMSPTLVGQHVMHEDNKEYVVKEVLSKDVKTNGRGQFVHVTWVDIDPV